MNRMFFFSKKINLLETDFFRGFTDCHSHLLFGVDDGEQAMQESLASLDIFEARGVKKVILTPHINTIYHDKELIKKHFAELKGEYVGNVELQLAAEYLLDAQFKNETSWLTIGHQKLLVESSYLYPTPNFDKHLYDIVSKGFTPVIAHPERYLYMNQSKYQQLKDCEYQFQLNLLSLSHRYGNVVKKRALSLLENDMYDYIGTDYHNIDSYTKAIDHIKLTTKQMEKVLQLKENNNKNL